MPKAAFSRTLAIATGLVFALTAMPSRAADDTVLRHVAGTVGYRPSVAGQLVTVSGLQTVPNDSYAVTLNSSQGTLQLADSSLIGVGSNTTVQVAALKRAADGTTGTTIAVPAGQNAWFRFEIKHPSGAKANYTFVTATSSVSARGTVGLISSVAQTGDTISCITCEPGDVTVTVGPRTYPLLSGQTLVVTLAGAVTTNATNESILQSFAVAGLTTTANASAPVEALANASRAGAGGGTAAAVGGAAAAAGIAAAASSHGSGNAAPAAPSPAPAPTASAIGTIQGRRR